MKFSKRVFLNLDLPDLLLNIWCYADYLNDQIINQYCKWCVEAAEEQWQPDFLDFQYVIQNLKNKNKNFYNFVRICSADENVIYRLITKE